MTALLPSLPQFDLNIVESISTCHLYISTIEKYSVYDETIDPETSSQVYQDLQQNLQDFHNYLERIDEYLFSIEVHSMEGFDISSNIRLDGKNNQLEVLRSRASQVEMILMNNMKLCAEALKNQGNAYFMQCNYALSLTKYEAACRIDNNEPIYYTNSALALQKMDKWLESIDYANKAIELDNNYLKAYIIRTKSYLSLNNVFEAAESLEQIPHEYESQHDVVELTQVFSVKAKDVGNNYFKNGDYDQALTLYSLAIKFDPENHLYYSNRSACHQAKRQWKEGKEDGLLVIDLNDTFPKGYIHVIRCQIQLNEFDQASVTLSDAINTLSTTSDWSTIKPQFDDLANAISNAKAAASARASSYDKSKAETLKAKGNQMYQSEKYQDAIRYYSQAIGTFPEEGTYFGNRAACWMMLKEYQQAINDCNQGLTLERQIGELDKLRLRLIDGLVHIGKLDEALDFIKEYNLRRKNGEQIEWFRGSTQFQEKQQTLLNIKQNIEAANVAMASNAFSRAKILYEQIQQKGVTEDVNLLVALAKAHLGLKELDAASRVSQHAITILGKKGGIKSIEAYTVRGEALAVQGLTEQACKFYSVAVQLDPDNQNSIQRLKNLKKILYDTTTVRKKIGEAMAERSYEVAISACTEGISIDRTCAKLMAEMHFKRAQAYKMLGKAQAKSPTSTASSSGATSTTEAPHVVSYKKCLQDSNSALYYDVSMIEAFYLKIEAMQTLNRHDEAVAELEQLVSDKQYRKDEEAHEKLKQAKLLLKRSKRKDFYALLLIENGSLASDEEIRKAYKKAALKWHPDRHSGSSEEKKKEAEIKFKEIQAAFELLTDPQKRRLYDQGYDAEEIEQKLEMEKQQQSYHQHGGRGHFGFH